MTDRDGSHGPGARGSDLPVTSDEELSRRPVKRKTEEDRTVLTVVRQRRKVALPSKGLPWPRLFSSQPRRHTIP